MRKTVIEKIKKSLINQKNLLLSKPHRDNEIDVDGDETDEIQGNILVALISQLNYRDTEKMKKIENALTKIQNNTFGFCEECSDQINEKRLETNPYFTLCISCAEEQEMIAKRGAR
jgi:DnaK suppressor protein